MVEHHIVRLLLAALSGMLLGVPAALTGRPGGLRPHMLVTVGSTLFCLTALEFSGRNPEVTRAIQGVASGIGFVGAATVLREEGKVFGIATAASIFNAGAVGCAVGLGVVHVGFVYALVVAGLNVAVLYLEEALHRVRLNVAGRLPQPKE